MSVSRGESEVSAFVSLSLSMAVEERRVFA